MKTGIKVSDAMTKKPVIASPDETVKICALRMIKENVGSLLVLQGEKILGFVTERDIIRKSVAHDLDAKKIKISQIMSKEIISIEPNRDIYDAILLMNTENVRRLPVIAKDKIVGLVTIKDIVKINPAMLELFMHQIHIREEGEKSTEFYVEGTCESCGSQGPVKKIRGKWICIACQR